MIEEKDLKVVQTDGKGYLGYPKGNVIRRAMPTSFDQPKMKEYVELDNLDDLQDITIGSGKTVIVRSLNVDEELQLVTYIKQMENVKRNALARVENQFFDRSF